MVDKAEAGKFRLLAASAMIPMTVITSFMSFYFMKWSTDVLLIAPAIVGAIIAFGSIWDGVTDPIVAAYSDQRRSAKGRRKPVMRLGVLLIVIGAPMMWLPPESLGSLGLIIWILLAVIVFEAGHSMFWVPLGALGLEVFTSRRRRLLLQLAVAIPALVVTILTLIGLNALLTSDAPRSVMLWLIGAPVAAFAIIGLTASSRLPEARSDHRARETSVWRMIADVLGNPYHRSILIVQATQIMANVSIILATPYLLDVVLGSETILPLVLATYFASIVLFQPLHYRNAKRIGLVGTWRIGIALWAVAFILIALAPSLPTIYGLAAAFGIAIFAGLAEGAGMVIYPIIGDLADYDSDQTAQRREGLYVTVFRLVGKIIAAGVTFAFGLGLQVSGYDPTLVTQPQSVTPDMIRRSLLSRRASRRRSFF